MATDRDGHEARERLEKKKECEQGRGRQNIIEPIGGVLLRGAVEPPYERDAAATIREQNVRWRRDSANEAQEKGDVGARGSGGEGGERAQTGG